LLLSVPGPTLAVILSEESKMPYDEALAERIRDVLADTPNVIELKMFGGLAFMVRGHMACGVVRDDLMMRLGQDGAAAALERPHVRPMDFTGRPMSSMVYVEPAGTDGEQLDDWVHAGIAYADQLAPKPTKPRRNARPAGRP